MAQPSFAGKTNSLQIVRYFLKPRSEATKEYSRLEPAKAGRSEGPRKLNFNPGMV